MHPLAKEFRTEVIGLFYDHFTNNEPFVYPQKYLEQARDFALITSGEEKRDVATIYANEAFYDIYAAWDQEIFVGRNITLTELMNLAYLGLIETYELEGLTKGIKEIIIPCASRSLTEMNMRAQELGYSNYLELGGFSEDDLKLLDEAKEFYDQHDLIDVPMPNHEAIDPLSMLGLDTIDFDIQKGNITACFPFDPPDDIRMLIESKYKDLHKDAVIIHEKTHAIQFYHAPDTTDSVLMEGFAILMQYCCYLATKDNDVIDHMAMRWVEQIPYAKMEMGFYLGEDDLDEKDPLSAAHAIGRLPIDTMTHFKGYLLSGSLQKYFTLKFGNEWYTDRQAGDHMIQLWKKYQTVDDLCSAIDITINAADLRYYSL